jgi:hypothetical protein
MCSGRVDEGIPFYFPYFPVLTNLTGLKAGRVLKEHSAATVIEMIASIQTYNDSVKSAKWLVHPLALLHSLEVSAEHSDEVCVVFRSTSWRTFDRKTRFLIAQPPRSKPLTSPTSLMFRASSRNLIQP